LTDLGLTALSAQITVSKSQPFPQQWHTSTLCTLITNVQITHF